MSDMSKKILGEIDRSHLKPKDKKYFILREIIFWFMTSVFIILGSLLFSGVLYKIFEGNFMGSAFNFNKILQKIYTSVPGGWLFLLLVFLVFGFYNYKCTKKSYKHRKRYILIASTFLVIILGSILYSLNIGEGVCRLISLGFRVLA